MKKRAISVILIAAMVLASVLALCSCGSNEDKDDAVIVHPISITMSIDYPDKSKIPDLVNESFKVEEDSTAFDAIQIYGAVNSVPILVETTGSTVEGINGVKNGDMGKRVWQFKINGKLYTGSPDDIKLKANDSLEWFYKPVQK